MVLLLINPNCFFCEAFCCDECSLGREEISVDEFEYRTGLIPEYSTGLRPVDSQAKTLGRKE